jgi:hypothetical protein
MTAVDQLSIRGVQHSLMLLPDSVQLDGAGGVSVGDASSSSSQLRGAEQALSVPGTEPKKHGLAALYEGWQMLRLLLISRPEARRSQDPRHQDHQDQDRHRRVAAMPAPGEDVPALPIIRQHLRGRGGSRSSGSGSGGGHDLERFSAVDVLLRPGVFNRAVSLLPLDKFAVFVVFVVTMSVHIGVAALFFFHAYLVVHAQTTLEFNISMHQPAREDKAAGGGRVGTLYDRGSYRRNFEEVFGPGPVLWALLPSRRAVHNDQDYCQPTGHFSRNRARVDTGYGNLLDV